MTETLLVQTRGGKVGFYTSMGRISSQRYVEKVTKVGDDKIEVTFKEGISDDSLDNLIRQILFIKLVTEVNR